MFNYICYFIIYAFIGWCCEVIFSAVTRGKFVNCGMLMGPVCPIYGVGVSLVILALTPLNENLPLLFLGSFVITSLLELVTGIILEKIFHEKWWDYSNQPLNFKGHICVKMSLLWGIACVFIMRIIQPLIDGMISWLNRDFLIIALICVYAVFAADLAFTAKNIIKFRRQMKLLDEMAAKIRVVSDTIGESIFEAASGAMKIKEKTDENLEQLKEKTDMLRSNIEEKRSERQEKLAEELAALREKYENAGRLMNAFPSLKEKLGERRDDVFEWLEKHKSIK